MRHRLGIATAFLLVTAGCGNPPTKREDPRPGSLEVSTSLSGTAATSVIVRVTAPDLPQALVFELAISNGRAWTTIEVPPGSNRTFLVHASDAKGIETHRASVTIDVRPGPNPAMGVTLVPVTVSTPITVTVGRFVVTVTSPTRTLNAGETARVQASITDESRAVVQGNVTWASTNPSIASVDATGLVTARRAGTVGIVAVYGAAAAAAAITVSGGSG